MGFSPSGTNGFGKTWVNGSSRVPLPPARITACTVDLLSCHDHSVNVRVLYTCTCSLLYAKVSCNPCSNVYCSFKPSSVFALVLVPLSNRHQQGQKVGAAHYRSPTKISWLPNQHLWLSTLSNNPSFKASSNSSTPRRMEY